jgi:hypothetical protein
MGAAFEVVTGYNNPSTTTAGTFSNYTANSGQSFTIRQANQSPAGRIFAPWNQGSAAGQFQIKSPRLHDTTIGTTWHFQVGTAFNANDPLQSTEDWDPAYATDILTVASTTDATQSATTYNACGIPIYYYDLPGVDANLMTPQQIDALNNPGAKVGTHYSTWVVPSSAGTAGQIGTGVAINHTNDQFKAGHSYALVGYATSAVCSSVLFSGTDTGNLYVGGPGSLSMVTTRRWFEEISNQQGLPLVPIIQANNKGNTFCYIVDEATTSTAFTVTMDFVDLGILTPPPGV